MATKKHIHTFKRENHPTINGKQEKVELKYVIPVDTSVQTLAQLSGANFIPQYSGDNMDISTPDLMKVKQQLIQLKQDEQNMKKAEKMSKDKLNESLRQQQIVAEAQKIVESQKTE